MSNQFVPVLALFNTELSAAITAAATTAYVKSVTSIPTAPFYGILDAGSLYAELVLVTVVTTATKALTIDRAEGGTTARAHPEDTSFHYVGANINAGDDTLMGGANKLYFRDSGMYIYSSADGTLNIVSDSVVNIAGIVIIPSGALYVGVGMTVTGAAVFNSGISVAGTTTVQALVAGGGGSIAGTTNLQTVIVGSSLAIAAGGTLTLPQKTSATQLPSADPSVAGELWCNSNVVTRSAG